MSNFKKNEEGAALVFVGVCLAVLLGFAALTFDLGRMAATQSDMQAYADHVALAAAGELDGSPGSRDRARAAAEQAIQDRQSFGTLEGQILDGTNDFTLRFLKALPPEDREYFDPVDDLNDAQYLAETDFEASMVEVTTRTESVFLPFYRAFGALSGNDVGDGEGIVFARAVAGYTQYACDIAVMMFCMPEDKSLLEKGNSIRLRTGSGSGGGQWQPGNFGFLDPTGDPNDPASQSALDPNGKCADRPPSELYACLIASSGNRTRCFAQRGVDMNTGQAVGIENAVFNTRFDIYNASMKKFKSDDVFAPAMHRVTGLVPGSGGGNDTGGGGDTGGGNVCLGENVEASPNSMAFPPDPCHAASPGCGAFGGSSWDVEGYVSKNYATATIEDLSGDGEVFADLPEQPTRYDVYLKEHQAAVDAANQGNGLPGENPDYSDKICGTPPSENPNRRVFVIAGIDCDANNVNGAKKGVPVEEYFEVFLMRPVGVENGGTGNFDLHVEMIGSAGGEGSGEEDDGGIFRVVVELLR